MVCSCLALHNERVPSSDHVLDAAFIRPTEDLEKPAPSPLLAPCVRRYPVRFQRLLLYTPPHDLDGVHSHRRRRGLVRIHALLVVVKVVVHKQ